MGIFDRFKRRPVAESPRLFTHIAAPDDRVYSDELTDEYWQIYRVIADARAEGEDSVLRDAALESAATGRNRDIQNIYNAQEQRVARFIIDADERQINALLNVAETPAHTQSEKEDRTYRIDSYLGRFFQKKQDASRNR